jgi:hypothetical protein
MNPIERAIHWHRVAFAKQGTPMEGYYLMQRNRILASADGSDLDVFDAFVNGKFSVENRS